MYVCRYVFMFMYMYVYVNKHMYKPYVCISICIPIYIYRERERETEREREETEEGTCTVHTRIGICIAFSASRTSVLSACSGFLFMCYRFRPTSRSLALCWVCLASLMLAWSILIPL